jgi:hypothetical protein
LWLSSPTVEKSDQAAMPSPGDPIMAEQTCFTRTLRLVLRGLALSVLLAVPAEAQNQNTESLARYVPAQGLAAYIEHTGFDAHPGVWHATATYKMLNETSLGTMLKEVLSQLGDRALGMDGEAPVTGGELVALLGHLADKGFAVGFCRDPGGPMLRPYVVVIRDALESELFRRVLERIPPFNEPAARPVEGPGGRKILAVDRVIGRLTWWYEKKDFVICFSADRDALPAALALDGKVASARTSPAYADVEKLDAGQTPVGWLFVNVEALGPMSPRARELGLDGVHRIEGRWGIQDKGIVITLAADAPRPRRGVLAYFDMPPIKPGTRVVPPNGRADYVLLSLDVKKQAEITRHLVERENDDAIVQPSPASGSHHHGGHAEREIAEAFAGARAFADRFRERTGLSLQDDVLAKIGPRMAVISSGQSSGSIMALWFHPPGFALVAELKDPRSFTQTFDRLIDTVNRELKSAGAMVKPQPGQPVRPGTEFAEFRKLKTPEQGYVLAVPPSVLPTPEGLRPTVLIEPERGVLVVATTPALARAARTALVLDAPAGEPPWPRNAIVYATSDPSNSLPELLENLPSLIQFLSASSGMRRPPFCLAIDPDIIPEADQLRPYLFPSKFSVAADDASIRMSAYQAFPLPAPSLVVGMESPVQSAREAAR